MGEKNFVGEECLHRQPGISLIFLSDFKSLLTQCCTVQRKCFTSRNVMVAEVILSHPLEVFLFASSEVSLGFKLYNASLKAVIKRAPRFLKSQHPNRAFIVSILKGKNWEDWRCNLGCAGALFLVIWSCFWCSYFVFMFWRPFIKGSWADYMALLWVRCLQNSQVQHTQCQPSIGYDGKPLSSLSLEECILWGGNRTCKMQRTCFSSNLLV